MSPGNFIVWCPACGARNRILREKWGDPARCGKCKNPIPVAGPFPDHAVPAGDRDFEMQVLRFPGPVVLEFFSPA